MVKAVLAKLLLSCLFLCACAQSDYIYYDVVEATHILNSQCNGTLTERVRSIEFSYNQIFNDFSYICALYVENATYFHLMLFEKPTELKENFYNASGLINVLVYDHDPNTGGLPVYELKDEETNRVAVVQGNRVWLCVSLNFDDMRPPTIDFDDIHWCVAYVAVVNDFMPVCDVSAIEETQNGVYIVRNNTFGSVADLVCSEGYVVDNSSRFAMCSVVDNVLSWIPGTALCSSVCEHPPNVVHANINPRMDTNIFLDGSTIGESTGYVTEEASEPLELHVGQQGSNISRTSRSPTIEGMQRESRLPINRGNLTRIYNPRFNNTLTRIFPSRTSEPPPGTSTLGNNITPTRTNTLGTSEIPTIRTNVTVYYTCNPPYVIHGLDRIHCGLDSSGVPRWFDPPPSCIIPACSRFTFREHSGAIVNPSYPDTTLRGGSTTCNWQISAPENARILVYIMYVHLPDIPGVGVSVIDAGTARPTRLLHLTNQSHPQNVTSETSVVKVIYRGPANNTSGYRGFYIQYVMQPRGDRLRKAKDTSTPTISQTEYAASNTSEPLSTIEWGLSSPVTHKDLDTHPDRRPGLSESSTGNTTELTNNWTTEHITTQDEEQQIMSTSVPPTSQGTNHTTQVFVSYTAQQTTYPFTEAFTNIPRKPLTEVTNHSFSNMTTPPVAASSQNTLTIADDTDDSGDVWKIVIGVIIPLSVLVLVLVGVFVCFRKKYPVRMMIGRDVTKVCNPHYALPVDCPALVREDASDFFSKRKSANSSEESVPGKICVVFENLGFSGDDSDDGQEHKFVEVKNWIFSESVRVAETSPASVSDSCSDREDTGMEALPGKSDHGLEQADREAKDTNGNSSVVANLQRRYSCEAKIAEIETGNSSGMKDNRRDSEPYNTDITRPEDAEDVSASDDDSGRSSPSSYKSESIDINSETPQDEESGFMKTSMILFQQPTFEEVWARVKARSKSLSVERPMVEIKQRSLTVDPGKSARKMSLHDDVAAIEHFRFLSSSARSDQQPETSPATPASLSEENNNSCQESTDEQESPDRQPGNSAGSSQDGRRLSATGGRFGHNNPDKNRNHERCVELADSVDESVCTDNIVNPSNDERNSDFHTSTDVHIPDDAPTTSETGVDAILSRKLSGSNRSDAEGMSSLGRSGLSHEEATIETQADAGARGWSKEKQIERQDSLENVEVSSVVKSQRDNANIASGTSVHSDSFPITHDANHSQTAAPRGHSNLLNRINSEQNIPDIERGSSNGEVDSHDVASHNSVIQNYVDETNDDIKDNLDDNSDDESTGVKVTDSDISDILDNSDHDIEFEVSGQELSDGGVQNLSSSHPETSITLQQDSDTKDTDV